eukprot:3299213-Pleurochrysis_carterae.AAC.1
MAHEQKAYGKDVEGAHRVTIVDGGIALNHSLEDMYPDNVKTRCRCHLVQDLNSAGPNGKEAIG